jgi:hypothetical protein
MRSIGAVVTRKPAVVRPDLASLQAHLRPFHPGNGVSGSLPVLLARRLSTSLTALRLVILFLVRIVSCFQNSSKREFEASRFLALRQGLVAL